MIPLTTVLIHNLLNLKIFQTEALKLPCSNSNSPESSSPSLEISSVCEFAYGWLVPVGLCAIFVHCSAFFTLYHIFKVHLGCMYWNLMSEHYIVHIHLNLFTLMDLLVIFVFCLLQYYCGH